MEEKIIPTEEKVNLALQSNDLTDQIVKETDPDKLEDLTNLFEMVQRKKNMLRINKLSNLLTLVDDEVIMRFTSTPETFDNDQLLKYMKSTQDTMLALTQDLDQKPIIQINNQKNEININNTGLDQESRKRVLEAVQMLLDNSKNPDIIEIEAEE